MQPNIELDRSLEKIFYVYFHKRPSDGSVFYVGKGTGRRAYSKQNRNKHWHNTVSKHGGYDVEIFAEKLDEAEAFELEVNCILDFGIENLCNITLGGGGASGLEHSEDSRKRMSESHKKRFRENPEEREKKLQILEGIFQRRRENPEMRKAISDRVKNWWKNLPEEKLKEISKLRSENSKRMWEDEDKRKELSDAIKLSFVNMDESTKAERQRKLSEASKKYFENMTEEQKKVLADRANRSFRSEKAIARYKEVRCRKLVLNRSYVVESRAELSRLLNVKGVLVNTMEDSEYQIKAGFFIENYNEQIHSNAIEISTLDGIRRIYPVSGNSKPVKNSNGEIFLSLKEAGDSLVNSKASDITKQGSITESCREGIRAYGVYWSRPSDEEIKAEIFKRLYDFLQDKEKE